MPPCEGLAQKWAPAIQENCSREVPEQPTFYRSGVDPPVRVRWGGLMWEFRKGGTIWLRGQPSWGADSRKRQFGGRFSREKAVQSGGFLIECANLRMSSSESQASVPLDETQKRSISPWSGIVVSRLEKTFSFVKISRNFAQRGVVRPST